MLGAASVVLSIDEPGEGDDGTQVDPRPREPLVRHAVPAEELIVESRQKACPRQLLYKLKELSFFETGAHLVNKH